MQGHAGRVSYTGLKGVVEPPKLDSCNPRRSYGESVLTPDCCVRAWPLYCVRVCMHAIRPCVRRARREIMGAGGEVRRDAEHLPIVDGAYAHKGVHMHGVPAHSAREGGGSIKQEGKETSRGCMRLPEARPWPH
jgi:hypothetical protein